MVQSRFKDLQQLINNSAYEVVLYSRAPAGGRSDLIRGYVDSNIGLKFEAQYAAPARIFAGVQDQIANVYRFGGNALEAVSSGKIDNSISSVNLISQSKKWYKSSSSNFFNLSFIDVALDKETDVRQTAKKLIDTVMPAEVDKPAINKFLKSRPGDGGDGGGGGDGQQSKVVLLSAPNNYRYGGIFDRFPSSGYVNIEVGKWMKWEFMLITSVSLTFSKEVIQEKGYPLYLTADIGFTKSSLTLKSDLINTFNINGAS